MSNYYITSVGKDANGNITNVVLHTATNNNLAKGVIVSKAEVVKKIDAGAVVTTLIWNYKNQWEIGAQVSVIPKLNSGYLRSNPDSTKLDNLDNLIPAGSYFS